MEAITYTLCSDCGGATDGIAHPRGHFCKCDSERLGQRNGRRRANHEWPVLDAAAYQGLAGKIVSNIEPHTEADPIAILVNLLSSFGNAAGRGPHFRVGADKHHLKINAALVGETSKARKGMSWAPVRDLMHSVDPYWTDERVDNGLSSGEGLIYQVRDKRMSEDKSGEPIVVDPGAEDKRLFVMEGEFASVLKVATRDGNTLSAIIRSAWDAGKLSNLTKNNPMRATHSHVSILGHITRTELVKLLSESDMHNGFANRFLWILVQRSKVLPFGGSWRQDDAAPLVKGLSSAMGFARKTGEIGWGSSAREPWIVVYEKLSEGRPGLLGAVTSRAESQVVRLACVYALLDCSPTIEAAHLEAALALWQYAEASARYIFGDATGDPIADKIEEALLASPGGLARNEIRGLFSHNEKSAVIGRALELLKHLGRVYCMSKRTGGRPEERWYAK